MLSTQMAAIAKTLIDDFGDTITLSKVDTQSFDPHNRQPPSETTITAKGVRDKISSNELVPDVIKFTDYKIVMYSNVDTIDKTWKINGDEIVHIDKIGFQDKLIIYEAFCRGDE